MYNLQLISTLVAKKLGNSIPGLPVENKILVYSPKEKIGRASCRERV